MREESCGHIREFPNDNEVTIGAAHGVVFEVDVEFFLREEPFFRGRFLDFDMGFDACRLKGVHNVSGAVRRIAVDFDTFVCACRLSLLQSFLDKRRGGFAIAHIPRADMSRHNDSHSGLPAAT